MARDKNGRDGEEKKKRARKRKARRTAADISSDDSEPEEKRESSQEEVATPKVAADSATSDGDETKEDEVMEETVIRNSSSSLKARANLPKSPKSMSADSSFSSWYLRQVAKELQDDLDKIRSASDFKDTSLPILINALQQGESLYSTREKASISASS